MRLPFSSLLRPAPTSTRFPYTTLFRSHHDQADHEPRTHHDREAVVREHLPGHLLVDRVAEERHAEQRNHDLQARSEEHTSELQSLTNLVCRLLLEKKKRERQNIQSQLN